MPTILRDGRFVLFGELGHGAQGQTLEAVDRRDGAPVAIKRFDVRAARTWKEAELAEREARVLRSLSHPRLPKYIDHFEEDGALYLVMTKIEGETLSTLRFRGTRFSEADVERFLADAADALAYLHGRRPPVIHRDIKPGNVLRRVDGSFCFVDFGAVLDRARPDGGSTVVGTFGYMAPEQFQGRALPSSDIYAVGATALAMLTGREPEAQPHKGLCIDVRSALAANEVSPRLVRALERMLDPNPDERASSLAPVVRALRRPKSLVARQERRAASRRARRERPSMPRNEAFVLSRPIAALLRLAVALGMLHVFFATQVVVPLVLHVLALFIRAPALRRAPVRVSAAGRRALARMAWVLRRIAARSSATGDLRRYEEQRRSPPVAAAPEAPIRVEADEPFEGESEELEALQRRGRDERG